VVVPPRIAEVTLEQFPVALVGALFGLRIFGQTLNLFSMIGMIMLFGLVAKNGILLVDYSNRLRRRGAMRAVEAMTTAAGTRCSSSFRHHEAAEVQAGK